MKSILYFISLLAGVQAHTIFQKVSVNGVDQGDLFGVRAPDSNFPINSAVDPNIACNTNIAHQDSNLITVPQGATVGTYWDHGIGLSADPNDPDSPVAPSHKGPIIAYLAKVDDAVASGTTDLQWFKVAAEGLNNGVWAVDNLKTNAGWWSFTMPTCVPAGQYLMRTELIALHGAYQENGAQFYMECAQIQVTGSGTSTPATVAFPGAYSPNDPGILVSIYDGNGQPTMGGQPYTIPGPPVLDCSSSGSSGSGGGSPAPSISISATAAATSIVVMSSAVPTTMVTSTKPGSGKPTKIAPIPVANPTPASNAGPATGSKTSAGMGEQCGGEGWAGPTTCSQGTCHFANQWFSQCY